MPATLGLAFLAGVLSTLSPCVLPLLPIILGSAASEHRLGPLALALGLAGSYVIVGLFVATIGFSIGIDADVFRIIAAALMVVLGLVLVAPALERRVELAAAPLGRWGGERLAGLATGGLAAQFGIGVLLGVVWTPCVGPTLGAASLLASQARDLPQAAATMAVFGLGAAAPLLAIGTLSREAMAKVREGLRSAGRALKTTLGLAFMLIGAAILSGIDRQIETWLTESSPQWLTDLTTRF
jgi:cytochrome c-type biogenesis protein